MLNPLNPEHRLRLAQAVEYSWTELDRFARMRDNTIKAYLGVSQFTPGDYWGALDKKYQKSLPKGNLLQTAGLSLQIALAYGEPQFLCTARTPEHAGIADQFELAINRMAKLLDLGETARSIAADSFFGYGIFKTGVMRLPLGAQEATGLQFGPCVCRVGQRNFLYDLTASEWGKVSFVGDIYEFPLEEAKELYPHAADRLSGMTDSDRFDTKHIVPRPSRFNSPEKSVLFIDLQFPGSKAVATWMVRNESFGMLADEPLVVRDYDGHWSGVYGVLNHLYSPDELVPVAQAESVKAIHYLFNDLMDITGNQARNAKINPLYQQAAEKDMRKIWDAGDRMPVGVIDPNRFGQFEIPGPTQSQTTYMAMLMQMFKMFVPTSDDPARAPTATQAGLDRQDTNAVVSEARRKFNRVLQLVGYKLGHLMFNQPDLILPASRPVAPGSNVMVDMTWRQPSGWVKIDDFDLNIEPYSTQLRTPEQRRDLMLGMIQQITMIMQSRAMGSPINVEKTIKMLSRLSGEPELLELYEELLPDEMAVRQSSRQSAPRPGVGQYVRHNVSEKTDEGAMMANMTQNMDSGETRVE